MSDLNQKLIVSLVIVPVLFGVFARPKEMGIAVAAISVALAFANLDKLESFSSAFFHGKLRTVVDRAHAAIDQLKELGLSISSPVLDEMAVSGRMLQYIPLEYKLERSEKIAATPAKLGASKEEIQDVCATLYQRVTADHVYAVIHSLKEANPTKQSLFEGLEDRTLDHINHNTVRSFIYDNNLTESADVKEPLADLEYFINNKKLRREERWQS